MVSILFALDGEVGQHLRVVGAQGKAFGPCHVAFREQQAGEAAPDLGSGGSGRETFGSLHIPCGKPEFDEPEQRFGAVISSPRRGRLSDSSCSPRDSGSSTWGTQASKSPASSAWR
ncbi:hypothetical protein [Streptomyces sp900116325]|uniref:hypothetical protein n=1 Tax=Streptomyces sp. 900116325 TaxID=3154295 RepID=UPI0033B785A5